MWTSLTRRAAWSTTPSFADNEVLIIQPRGGGADVEAYVKLTLSSGPTAGGSGDGAHKWYTWDASEGSGSMVTPGDCFLIGTNEPPKQKIYADSIIGWSNAIIGVFTSLSQWPQAMAAGMAHFINSNKNLQTLSSSYLSLRAQFGDMLNTVFAKLDGSNVTKALKQAIQGNNESMDLTVTRVTGTPAAAGQIGLDGLQNGIGQVLLWPPATTTDNVPLSADDLREYQTDDFLELGNLRWELGSTPWQVFQGSVLTATVRLADGYTYDANDLIAVNASGTLHLDGRDIHLGLVLQQIFKRNSPNIGGKGGTAGQYWKRGSGDEDAGWGRWASG